MTKLISWNVNGLRANLKKDFMEHFAALDADVFMLQEIKLQAGQVELDLPGYHQSWSYAEKKGYSGTALFSREKPLQLITSLEEALDKGEEYVQTPAFDGESSIDYEPLTISELDGEGRITACEFDQYWAVCVYTPNIQPELARLNFRMSWDDAFRAFLQVLARDKPVIVGGDFNVAHQEIDLARPKPNIGKPGFSYQERGKFTELLSAGFSDPLRKHHPDTEGLYSWWSYRANARANNVGWRIDYFLCSEHLLPQAADTPIHTNIHGSDHCPVGLVLHL